MKTSKITYKSKEQKDPPLLEWTGPDEECSCSSYEVEMRECQGCSTCKCGKKL